MLSFVLEIHMIIWMTIYDDIEDHDRNDDGNYDSDDNDNAYDDNHKVLFDRLWRGAFVVFMFVWAGIPEFGLCVCVTFHVGAWIVNPQSLRREGCFGATLPG